MITSDDRISRLIRLFSCSSMLFPIINRGRNFIFCLISNSKIIDRIIPINVGQVEIAEPEPNINNFDNKSPFSPIEVHSKPTALKLDGSTFAKRLAGMETAVHKQSINIKMIINVLVLI